LPDAAAASPFDPSTYPGFDGDWLADNSIVALGLVTSVPVSAGAVGSLNAIGTSPLYEAAGWPTDASPTVRFDNVAARVLTSTTGYTNDTDWTSFHVLNPDSALENADVQWAMFVGTWGALFGIAHTSSFTPQNTAYRQDEFPNPFFAYAADALAGPQVWAVVYRAADSPQQVKLYRNGVLVLSGDCVAAPCDAVTVGSGIVGVPLGPGNQFNGTWKRSIHYEGSGLTAPNIATISAALIDLYT
jgi:hypothetical protein